MAAHVDSSRKLRKEVELADSVDVSADSVVVPVNGSPDDPVPVPGGIIGGVVGVVGDVVSLPAGGVVGVEHG